jgi:protein TonB
MPAAAGISFAVHAAVLLSMAINGLFWEERAAGAADDLVLIEGIPVELIDAAPVPEALPSDALAEAETTTEPAHGAAATAVEPAETPEPMAEAEPEAVPDTEPAQATAPETLPAPEAATGELAARPEAAPTAPKETEEPSPAESADGAAAEDKPAATGPADIPAPRLKPERTQVAEAGPPPEPAEEREAPKAPAPVTPAAPPPSAPTAAQSAARSGGAGGGGRAQTAGNAAASAYRAKVAAQLKRKRFYPSAARRDRLTGSATVSFTLNASGRVTAARVVRSSGKRILDEAAIEMVRRASPYPPIPPGLGSTITIQAPIAFDLSR